MPPKLHRVPWPKLQESYLDEFGYVDPHVYKIAAGVWSLAESQIARTIKDPEAGHRLMMEAIAIVSRKCAEDAQQMTNVRAYLFTTFHHLLMKEFLKRTPNTERDARIQAQFPTISERSESDIARTILVHEILERADAWTREVFELRSLGHSFDEIGEKYGMQGNYVRSQWSKRMLRLAKRISRETQSAEKKILKRYR